MEDLAGITNRKGKITNVGSSVVVGVFLTLKIYRRNMVPGGHKINILYFINSILNLNKAQQCTVVVVVNGVNRRTELSSCFIVELPSQVNALKAEQTEPDMERNSPGFIMPISLCSFSLSALSCMSLLLL